MRLSLSLLLSTLFFVGCSTNATVSPSQNSSLNTVSPNTTTASKGGTMQSSLDSWLKEDWLPNSEVPAASSSTNKGTAASASTPITATADEKPFTLQSYADKWKVYHENKEKMDAGKPKEPSHIDTVNALPVIGR